MNREEIINEIKPILKELSYPSAVSYLTQNDKKWLEETIKALEQESILDRIRAEVERQEKWLTIAGYNTYNVDIALDAIKSMVAESEG